MAIAPAPDLKEVGGAGLAKDDFVSGSVVSFEADWLDSGSDSVGSTTAIWAVGSVSGFSLSRTADHHLNDSESSRSHKERNRDDAAQKRAGKAWGAIVVFLIRIGHDSFPHANGRVAWTR